MGWAGSTRWVTDHDEHHSQWLIDRFRNMAAQACLTRVTVGDASSDLGINAVFALCSRSVHESGNVLELDG